MNFTFPLFILCNANLNANRKAYNSWVESRKLYNSYFAASIQRRAGQRRRLQASFGKIEGGRVDPLSPPPQTWSWLSGHSRRGDPCSRLWIFIGVLGSLPTMQGPCMFLLAQGLPASPACPSLTPHPYPRLTSGLRFPPDAGGGGLEKSSQAPPLPMSSPPRSAADGLPRI